MDRTLPNGRVIGIDVIPAQPPKGVSTIQGNFLSRAVQDEVKRFLRDSDQGRLDMSPESPVEIPTAEFPEPMMQLHPTNYFESEKNVGPKFALTRDQCLERQKAQGNANGPDGLRIVDVVLSDMSAPWEMTEGFWKRSLSDPYFRMMNTSGMSFRDHAGSMVRQLPSAFNDTSKLSAPSRIYVTQLYSSGSTPSVRADTSFANSTKGLRIND